MGKGVKLMSDEKKTRHFRELQTSDQIDFLKYMVMNWGKQTSREMEEKWNLPKGVVNQFAGRMRKKNIPLQRLNIQSVLEKPELVVELQEVYKRSHTK